MKHLLLFLLMASNAFARFPDIDVDIDLPTIPGVPSPGQVIGSVATLGRFRVSIKNETPYAIYVAWSRIVRQYAHQGDPGSDEWVNEGWYHLAPGEEAYIGTTTGRNVYFYAETVSGQGRDLQWGGEYNEVVRGRTVGMFHTDMGHSYNYFTQRFTWP